MDDTGRIAPPPVPPSIQAWVTYAVPFILSCFAMGPHPAECLLMTRIVVDAARQLGHDAYALAVRYVLIPPGARDGDVAVALGVTPDEQAQLPGNWIQTRSGFEAWHGHVLAVLDRRHLVDPTLDQVNHHNPALRAEPLAFTFPDARTAETWQRGRGSLTLHTTEGLELRIDARPRDRSFKDEPAWSRDDLDDVIAGAAAAVRQRTRTPRLPHP